MGYPSHGRSFLPVLGLLAALSGCGPHIGAWLYTLGMVPEEKVAAADKLPEGPLLILVDDETDLVQPPVARLALVDALSEQFRAHGIADKITTNEELARLRQAAPDFDQLSIREVARRAQSETVLWINVEDFAVEDNLELLVTPARFAVRLKVFNARAEDKQDLRLWPGDRQGHFLAVAVSPHDLRPCKSMAEVHQKIAAEMADRITKLFYDHVIQRQ